MAHRVKLEIPKAELEWELDRRDLKFRVERDGKLQGRLLVSKGGLEWRKGKLRRTITWGEFADFAASK